MPTRKSNDEENSAPEPRQEQVTTEATPEEVVQKSEPEAEPTNVVRYTGLVSERRISKEDWEQAGVSDQDGVVWTKDANNIVPINQFSEEALQVLANTGEFEVIRDVKD